MRKQAYRRLAYAREQMQNGRKDTMLCAANAVYTSDAVYMAQIMFRHVHEERLFMSAPTYMMRDVHVTSALDD